MRLFNRDWRRIRSCLPLIPELIISSVRVLFHVRRPWKILFCYILRKPVASRLIEFRNGLKIHTSGHPDDLATAILIFFRPMYLGLDPGSTVLDIGANIGLFSLWAVTVAKADKVYAFEPCRESMELLERNIAENHLEGAIIPFRAAVCGKDPGAMIEFPVLSDPCNSIDNPDGIPTDAVVTTTVEEILDKTSVSRVDYAKLDCEGAEYEIIFEMPRVISARIGKLVIEYHAGRQRELIDFLGSRGFVLTAAKKVHPHLGILAFGRPLELGLVAHSQAALL